MNASLEEEVGQHTVDRKVPAQLCKVALSGEILVIIFYNN